MRISQTSFQNWFRPLLYQGANIADELTKVSSSVIINHELRKVGFAPEKVINKISLSKKQKEQGLALKIMLDLTLVINYKSLG